jgi:hypothetical protein
MRPGLRSTVLSVDLYRAAPIGRAERIVPNWISADNEFEKVWVDYTREAGFNPQVRTGSTQADPHGRGPYYSGGLGDSVGRCDSAERRLLRGSEDSNLADCRGGAFAVSCVAGLVFGLPPRESRRVRTYTSAALRVELPGRVGRPLGPVGSLAAARLGVPGRSALPRIRADLVAPLSLLLFDRA